jgi:hypothetical protein
MGFNSHQSEISVIQVGSWQGITGEMTPVSEDSIPAVPEPSTWTMMILGFAGIGAMAYRRKQNGPAPLRVA